MNANADINIFRRSYITKSSNDLAVMKGLIKPTIMSKIILRYCSKIYKIYIALFRNNKDIMVYNIRHWHVNYVILSCLYSLKRIAASILGNYMVESTSFSLEVDKL